MNTGRAFTVFACYCLIALVMALLGVASTPITAHADGGAITPPSNPPNPPADSTLNAISTPPPGEAEARQGSDPAFNEAVDLIVQFAFTLKM